MCYHATYVTIVAIALYTCYCIMQTNNRNVGVTILNYSFNEPLLSLQLAKCEFHLAFWTQLAPFYSSWRHLCLITQNQMQATKFIQGYVHVST